MTAAVILYGQAEVVCSNCGKKETYQNYRFGEPCRFCGYKRTELSKILAAYKFEVWYAKEPTFNEDDYPKTQAELEEGYVHLATVWADSIGIVYHMMQGEVWSKDGYARPVIQKLGLKHTSMSVGDLVKSDRLWFVVAGVGFNPFELEAEK